MKKKTTEKEIQDVMAEEKSRGKRKIDREAQILRRQFEEEVDFFRPFITFCPALIFL